MGKSGSDAEGYAKEVVLADFEKPGHDDVVQKLVKDLAAAGKPTEEHPQAGRAPDGRGEDAAHGGHEVGRLWSAGLMLASLIISRLPSSVRHTL
jgi:hypothetical protein